jgi:hypothetical protein
VQQSQDYEQTIDDLHPLILHISRVIILARSHQGAWTKGYVILPDPIVALTETWS